MVRPCSDISRDERWKLRRDDGARQYPDLGFVGNGRYLAVEVELHAKAPSRVSAIMRAYERHLMYGQLDGLIYVVDNAYVENLISRQAKTAGIYTRTNDRPAEHSDRRNARGPSAITEPRPVGQMIRRPQK